MSIKVESLSLIGSTLAEKKLRIISGESSVWRFESKNLSEYLIFTKLSQDALQELGLERAFTSFDAFVCLPFFLFFTDKYGELILGLEQREEFENSLLATFTVLATEYIDSKSPVESLYSIIEDGTALEMFHQSFERRIRKALRSSSQVSSTIH